jgi:hypothetical protein
MKLRASRGVLMMAFPGVRLLDPYCRDFLQLLVVGVVLVGDQSLVEGKSATLGSGNGGENFIRHDAS